MNRMTKLGLASVLAGGMAMATMARAEEQREPKTPVRQSWSFAGPFGKYDQAQLQRGFFVFRKVCSNCHTANLMSFRNLSEAGGPEFSEAQVKALAADYQIQDGPGDDGKMFQRPGRPADHWPAPDAYPNPEAAKAAFGAAPPDMSVLAKGRGYERGFPTFIGDLFTQYQEHGPDYIYSLLSLGYTNSKDLNSNDYFQPSQHIAMPKPLSDKLVPYTDGSPQTVDQYARDVTAFLYWMAEPKLEERKKIGFRVMVFLLIFAGLLYYTKKKVWADAH